MTNYELEAVERLQEENRRLKKRVEILEKAYEPIYRPKSWLLLGDDTKPIRQIAIEQDPYSDGIELENRHGARNRGRPITQLVLDCVNAVCKSQWIYTQLMKPEVFK